MYFDEIRGRRLYFCISILELMKEATTDVCLVLAMLVKLFS